MGLTDVMKKIRFPGLKDLTEAPHKIREETEKVEINKVRVRYFDRDCKNCIESVGIKTHKTSIPIIYFNKPDKLAVIDFDGASYMNKSDGVTCIDVVEDYLFGIKRNSELAIELGREYYNDLRMGKLDEVKTDELMKITGAGYCIPVLLNRIPREIIRINPRQQFSVGSQNKTEITQYIIRQLGTVRFLERLDVKDNSILFGCMLVFIPVGILIGVFLTMFFLK